jgi:glycosyltransferase involved in cell wall biosynthesis
MPEDKERPYLSVVIPSFNEAERLPNTLIAIDAYLSKVPYAYEIFVVNDGSKDNTAEIVRKMSIDIKNLALIDNEENKGKGAAVREGMLAARGKFRLFMDADNSTGIDHFEKMIPRFADGAGFSSEGGERGYDVVIGSRAVPGARLDPPQPAVKRILGKGSNLIIQITNIPGIWDTQCGFKAFTSLAAETIFSLSRIDGWGFDIELLALARALHYQTDEIPVYWVNDPGSRVRLSSYLKVLAEDVKIRWWLWTNAYGLRPSKKPQNLS